MRPPKQPSPFNGRRSERCGVGRFGPPFFVVVGLCFVLGAAFANALQVTCCTKKEQCAQFKSRDCGSGKAKDSSMDQQYCAALKCSAARVRATLYTAKCRPPNPRIVPSLCRCSP